MTRVCQQCGGPVPDPATVAKAATAGAVLPTHEQVHMCPGPIVLVAARTHPNVLDAITEQIACYGEIIQSRRSPLRKSQL
jgi:hypothetical protein